MSTAQHLTVQHSTTETFLLPKQQCQSTKEIQSTDYN